jgi:hypothetical protein
VASDELNGDATGQYYKSMSRERLPPERMAALSARRRFLFCRATILSR